MIPDRPMTTEERHAWNDGVKAGIQYGYERALKPFMYRPTRDDAPAYAECRDCGVELSESEYQPDYDMDETGYVFCGREHCHDCWAERD